jgi:Glycosyltransferase
VLHCPFYYRPLVAPCPSVVVIHDLLPVTHPEWFPRRGRHPFAELMLWSARYAAAVITPSRAVLEELEAVAGPLGGRGRAIPHGVDGARFRPRSGEELAALQERLGVRPPYLVMLGSLQPRRGIETALGALAILLERRPELRLVIAGKSEHPWGAVPARLAHRVVLTGYLADADLPPLLAGAAAALALSRGEGFDLPLLEALACGTPVVASDIAVHREHFAAWARLVPAGDAEAVASAVEAVLESPPSAGERDRQAAAVRGRFRWRAAARAYVAVWREAAGGNAGETGRGGGLVRLAGGFAGVPGRPAGGTAGAGGRGRRQRVDGRLRGARPGAVRRPGAAGGPGAEHRLRRGLQPGPGGPAGGGGRGCVHEPGRGR